MSSYVSTKEPIPKQQHANAIDDATAPATVDLGPVYEAGSTEVSETTSVSEEPTNGADVNLAGATGSGDGLMSEVGFSG